MAMRWRADRRQAGCRAARIAVPAGLAAAWLLAVGGCGSPPPAPSPPAALADRFFTYTGTVEHPGLGKALHHALYLA